MAAELVDPLDALAEKLDGVRWRARGQAFVARCPAHDDSTPSLSVARGTKGQPVVLTCHGNCGRDDILKAVGLTWRDLCSGVEPARPDVDDWMPCGMQKDAPHDWRHRKVAEYEYRDADGTLVFAVARCALKGDGCQGFRQWRPDPTKKSGKRWSRKLDDGTTVGEGLPYRLPDALKALQGKPFTTNLWIVEGEKDAERLRSMGYTATCNAGGAGKWTQAHADHFRGLKPDVMVMADYDRPGYAHAEQVVTTFLPIARGIEVVRAAVDVKGADLSDHLDAGFGMHQLVTVDTPLADPGLADLEVWA
ncbi:hypothetical protein [Dactylosporangium sp. NPDC006015]|uniref:hypothetical protein n=1 Tax=Dactylosporangium sp. NPDC006015 TaxID=3154576 RepID=UPI0033BE361C